MSSGTVLTSTQWPDVRQFEQVAAAVLCATAPRVTSGWHSRGTCTPMALRLAPLRGGLQSAAVARVNVTAPHAGSRRVVTFVVKRLHDDGLREAAVYRWLETSKCAPIAPRCFAIQPAFDGSQWLFLEALRPLTRWPWRQMEHVTAAIDRLGFLHHAASVADFQASVPDFEYEVGLARRSRATLDSFDVATAAGDTWLRAYRPALRRIVDSLPTLRQQMHTAVGFARAVLHGDVHSRNLLVCRRTETTAIVFADWARARSGSPLEDLSSWLHSLSFWEPEVHRRHDTLLKHYFDARGLGDAWARHVRDAYWIASASNALAGSLEYYLDLMVFPAASSRTRQLARCAAREWLRIIRRADAVSRTQGAGRPGRRDASDRRTTAPDSTLSSDGTTRL